MWLLTGDSIAVGLGSQLHPDALIATVGQGSGRGAALIRKAPQRRVVVSLGANDSDRDGRFRARVASVLRGRDCVVWLAIPEHPRLNRILTGVTDSRLHVVRTHVPRSDGIHPTAAGYKSLAFSVRRALADC